MAGPPLLPVVGNRTLRLAGEEDRFLECPICFLPMDNIVFLGCMPDNPSQKWSSCRDGFCASCVKKALENAAQRGVIPTCALCRREIVSVIDGVESVRRLVSEYHKGQELKKEADGWRGIIAALNMQLKKARDDAKQAPPDPDRAAGERERAALVDEVAKLRSQVSEMAKSVDQAEQKRKEKEDLAKHAIANSHKEREEMQRRIEEAKDACARQLLVKQQRMDEAAAAYANEVNVLNQELSALRDAAALVQQDAVKAVERRLAAVSRDLAAESEAARAAEQKLQEEKAAREREKTANQLEIRTLSAKFEELKQKLEADKQSQRAQEQNMRAQEQNMRAQEAKLQQQLQRQLKEASEASEAELRRLHDQVAALTSSLAQARLATKTATDDAEARAREREADLRRKVDQLHAEKTVVEGKLTSLGRRTDQFAAIEKKAEEAQVAEGALRQQLIDKSNQIFSLEQHNAALQTHIKELKGRISKMDGGSSSRILSPPPPSGNNLSASMTSQPAAPALNNSYLGMLSSSITSTVASVSSAPLSSWWGSGSQRSRGFIKTSADYHKFSEKHNSISRFAFPTCRGKDIAGGGYVFVCRVRVSKSTPSTALYREMMYTATLRHQNIIRLDGVIREKLTENDFLLELALAPFVEESLEDAIRSLRFSPADVRSMFHQLLSMLHYLHSAGLVIRYLNPGQLLFSPRECVLKLGIMSSVRSLHSLPFDPIPPSALHYTAPELLYTSVSSPQTNWRAADCWSVGCVLAEILLGRPLFEGCKDSVAILRRILSIPSLRPKTFDEVISAQFPVMAAAAESLSHLPPLPAIQLVEILPDAGAAEIDLIARLMCLVPQYRITIKQALDHACFPAGQFSGAVESGLGGELADDQIQKWVENVGLFK